MKLPTQRLCTFLTFNGTARAAMDFYVEVLPDARIESLVLFGKDEPRGDEGTVLNGMLGFGGQTLLFMDMESAYPAPTFNWATSLFVTCDTEEQFDNLFSRLSENGNIMMGPEPVMGLRKCTWFTDKFGVTWQLVWQ